MDGDGGWTHDDNEKAELFNKFFTSIFTQEDISKIPKRDTIHTWTPLTHIEITPEKVEKKLLKSPNLQGQMDSTKEFSRKWHPLYIYP